MTKFVFSVYSPLANRTVCRVPGSQLIPVT